MVTFPADPMVGDSGKARLVWGLQNQLLDFWKRLSWLDPVWRRQQEEPQEKNGEGIREGNTFQRASLSSSAAMQMFWDGYYTLTTTEDVRTVCNLGFAKKPQRKHFVHT